MFGRVAYFIYISSNQAFEVCILHFSLCRCSRYISIWVGFQYLEITTTATLC